MDPLAVLAYGAEQAPPLIGLECKWKQQYSENGNWVENVIDIHQSCIKINSIIQHHFSDFTYEFMKSLMSKDSGIHHLHFTASDIPLQAFSDFTKVSRSPIIRSIRLLAAHAMVASRHLYIISWAHCGLRRLLLLYPSPADSQWTQLCDFQNWNRNRKPVLALPKTEKPVLQNEPGFGNPNCIVILDFS